MNITATVKFNNQFPAVKKGWATKVENGLNEMANDVMRLSNPTTPKDTGRLRSNRNKEVTSRSERRVVWKQPYAGYQERGHGRGPIKRYTTPGTGAHFAENAVNEVKKNVKRYFL